MSEERRLLIAAASAMAACAPATASGPAPAVHVAPSLPPSADVEHPAARRSNGDTDQEGEVLLRFRVEGTFGVVVSCAPIGMPQNRGAIQPFGRVPAFTLYEDGSAIYVRSAPRGLEQVLRAQIGKDGAAALLERARALGLEKIDSRPHRCDPATSPASCVTDASVTVLEARSPTGARVEVRNYAAIAVEQKALDDVIGLVTTFHHASELPYLPSWATLVVERCDPDEAAEQQATFGTFAPWPLAPALLKDAPPGAASWARRVTGESYEAFYGELPFGTMRGFTLRGAAYTAFLVPILPGADTTGIDGWHYP